MTVAERWKRRPQNLWLRRALFQVHLWTGIAIGIYIAVISVTGSAIVFRNEIYAAFTFPPKIVEATGPRLTREQIDDATRKAYPGYAVTLQSKPKDQRQAVEVWV